MRIRGKGLAYSQTNHLLTKSLASHVHMFSHLLQVDTHEMSARVNERLNKHLVPGREVSPGLKV